VAEPPGARSGLTLIHSSRWPSRRAKLQTAARLAFATCFTLYAAIAVASARAFGADVDKNILVSLGSERGRALVPPSLVSGVNAAMTVVMVCVFPLNAYGLRVGLHALAHGERPESACQRWAGTLLLTLYGY